MCNEACASDEQHVMVQQAPSLFMFAVMQSTHKIKGERRRNVGLIDMREVKRSIKSVWSRKWHEVCAMVVFFLSTWNSRKQIGKCRKKFGSMHKTYNTDLKLKFLTFKLKQSWVQVQNMQALPQKSKLADLMTKFKFWRICIEIQNL